MKKFIKIIILVLAAVVFLLAVTPFIFRGKLEKIAKEQINKSLNAEVGFDRISLSVFKNFPNISAGVRGLYVANTGAFTGDTLFSAGAVDITVDIVSALKKTIIIRKILVEKPSVKAHILKDGAVNWDIMKPSDEIAEEDTASSDMDMNVKLKMFRIVDGFVEYIDDSSNIHATLKDIGFTIKGDMARSLVTLDIDAAIDAVNVAMGGVKYLNDAIVSADVNVDADMDNSVFTLKENAVSLNDLILNFAGTVSMPESGDIITDLTYGLEKTEFKSLLSLIPAVYMTDFNDLEASGNFSLTGTVKGTYSETTMPDVNLALNVGNGEFRYPGLPAAAQNINIDAAVFYDGVQTDNSTVDVNRFQLNLGSNPVSMTLNVKTPVSDMFVNGNLNLDIDLATISQVIPLDSVNMSGRIKSDIDIMGNLSTIENERYEDFKAGGAIEISNLVYGSKDLPADLSITRSSVFLTPRYVDVKSFDAVLGKSDFKVSGRLENFIPYVFSEGTVKGDFIFTSGTLDLNEFMAESTEAATEEDTTAMAVIEVPGNIDFRLISRIDHVFYDKLQIDNLVGTLLLKNQSLVLENTRMDLLDGTVRLSGEYNTRDILNPVVDFGISANAVDIPAAFKSFSTLQAFAPIAQKAIGKVDIMFDYSSYLGNNMMPVLSSITGKGQFNSKTIGLRSSTMFSALGNALNTNSFENMTLNNLAAAFEIRNGRLIIEPFEIKAGNATFIIGGDQGLDQTMNFVLGLNIPSSALGPSAGSAINNLVERASVAGITINPAENLNISATIGGTFTKPEVSLNLRENTANAMNEIREQAVQAVQEQVDKKKEEAMAAAKAEADKIIAAAEGQVQVIRDNAQKAADVVRQEAEANAAKLVEQAKDPISRRLAEEAGKKLIQEAEKSAANIISEGDRRAEEIMQAARDQASRLLE